MLAMSPLVTPAHLAGTRVISSGGSPISSSILDKLRGKTHEDCEIKVRQPAILDSCEAQIKGGVRDDGVSDHQQDQEVTAR